MSQHVFGLIGYPLGHSFSKRYFTDKFEREGISDAVYELFPLPTLLDFPAWVKRQPSLRGLNVTIPYKEAILPYLDTLSIEAKAIGAVNCIRIAPNGFKTGFNTDVIGFRQSLANLECQPEGALVLGTGGAAKAVVYVLLQLAIPYLLVSRAPTNGALSWGEVRDYLHQNQQKSLLLVNTTPLGMYPNTEDCPPLPFELLGPQHFVYDLIYNPEETVLLRRARLAGCAVKNGLEMLYGQAEAAWQIWHD
jgi:shikimate dehydrogenase